MLFSPKRLKKSRVEATPSATTVTAKPLFRALLTVARMQPSAITPRMTIWRIPALFNASASAGFVNASGLDFEITELLVGNTTRGSISAPTEPSIAARFRKRLPIQSDFRNSFMMKICIQPALSACLTRRLVEEITMSAFLALIGIRPLVSRKSRCKSSNSNAVSFMVSFTHRFKAQFSDWLGILIYRIPCFSSVIGIMPRTQISGRTQIFTIAEETTSWLRYLKDQQAQTKRHSTDCALLRIMRRVKT